MSRPRKPTSILEASGAFLRNPKRKAAREGEMLPEQPLGPPPGHLEAGEKAVWLELQDLIPPAAVACTDRISLEIVCCLINQFRSHRRTMPGSVISILVGLLGKFGMTPSDRSGVIAAKERQGDPLDDFLRKTSR